MIRSDVSARVVYRSRGKPENADLPVFITVRSVIPDVTVVPASFATTIAVRVAAPLRRNASGATLPPGPTRWRQACSWIETLALDTWAAPAKCRASTIPNDSIAPVRCSGANA